MSTDGGASVKLDVLLFHVPKFNNYYKPLNHFSFIHLPPMGLLGLADYLRKNQFSTEIIHLGVEREKSGTIDLDKLIAERQPSIVGLDLHWHFQSYDVIEVARKIKRSHPEVAVVLGGFTASYFAEEILRMFDCVDFIIHGDSEVPLVELAARHRSDKDYTRVPNLVYRNSEGVHSNPTEYVADQTILENVCFTDFTLMKDYQLFIDSFSKYMNIDGLSQSHQKALTGWKKSYPVFLGRGCLYNCSYCGGSFEAQKIINNRPKPCLRSIESILDSIRDLQRFGFEFGYLALDPLPTLLAEDFYFKLFDGLQQANISMSFEVERYSLPTRRFLQRFRETLGKDSFITLSPNSHSEEIRRKNGLHRYSNDELEECLQLMEEEQVNCALFFTCGLPFESAADMKEMANYQRSLRKRFKRIQCKTSMIEIEPGSPMSRDPQAYGVTPHRVTFADYYHYHSQPSQNHFLEMGYDREGCPDQKEVARFFCSNFCSHFKTGSLPPRVCKTLCDTSAVMWKLGLFNLADKVYTLSHKS